MSQFAAMLVFTFLIKLTIVILLSRILRKYCRSFLESSMAAWVLLQIGVIAWMLLLSAFNSLNGEWIWIGLSSTTGILILYEVIMQKRNHIGTFVATSDVGTFSSTYALIPVIVLFAIFAFFTYRSFYYYDNTSDAIAYGLTRISIFAHAHSLFTFQNTPAINIFADEWNGELNALFYVLATGKDQASSFSNAEIWLVTCLGFTWLFEYLKVDERFRLLLGLVLSTTPVILGLAMTVKGDLLSIAAFILSIGFILRYYTTQKNSFYFLLAIASLGLSLGSKKTLIITIGLFYLILTFDFLRTHKATLMNKLALFVTSGILFLIGNFRYFLNMINYHDPFIRLEKNYASVSNVFQNLKGILGYLYVKPFSPPGSDLLSAGIGILGLAFTVVIVYQFFVKVSAKQVAIKQEWSNIPKLTLVLLFLAFILGVFIFALEVKWYAFSFRYFSAWLFTVFVLLLAYNMQTLRKSSVFFLNAFWLMIMGLNYFIYMIGNPEAFPNSFQSAIHGKEIQRKMAGTMELYPAVAAWYQTMPKNSPSHIMMFNTPGTFIYPFLGDEHTNNLQFVMTFNKIQQRIEDGQSYDSIILCYGPGANLDQKIVQLTPWLNAHGYVQQGELVKKYFTIYYNKKILH